MKKMIFVIRIIITSIFLWFIYGETGPVTTIFAALMGLHTELLSAHLKLINAIIKEKIYHK